MLLKLLPLYAFDQHICNLFVISFVLVNTAQSATMYRTQTISLHANPGLRNVAGKLNIKTLGKHKIVNNPKSVNFLLF